MKIKNMIVLSFVRKRRQIMKSGKFSLLLIVINLFVLIPRDINGCTTAVISDSASRNRVPILWKNRDTGYLSNKIIFVKESPNNFVAIVNSTETSGRFVYAGLNSKGFAITNTVAYNLPKVEKEIHDLEGQIMSDALRTCSTVDDFEKYIKKNLGKSLGSWSTFSVIDGEGGSTLFEVHNNGYKRYDTSVSEKKYLVVTNFARSGEKDKGAGYLRFEQATKLFMEIPMRQIDHQSIFQKISRDIGNPLVKHPSLSDLKEQPSDNPLWIHSRNCINRPSTSGAVIITGRKSGDPYSIATLWVILGEPLTSIAVPVWVEAGSSPVQLQEGETAPICRESLRIKKIIHPFSEGSKINYMNVTRLVNREGTGFLPVILETENKIFLETAEFLKNRHSSDELSEFQTKMSEMALNTLRKIK